MDTIKEHKKKIKEQVDKLKKEPQALKTFLEECENYLVLLKKKTQHEQLALEVFQEVKTKVYEDGEKRLYPQQFEILWDFVNYQRKFKKAVDGEDSYIILNYD